jgi:hypothetical protein
MEFKEANVRGGPGARGIIEADMRKLLLDEYANNKQMRTNYNTNDERETASACFFLWIGVLWCAFGGQ